ncbi:hypothetical protein [Frankia sp. Cas3]|uniref:hypothetical protein n=1 Tax=Frankia sp. Cas3 TaxID=3073926 RepID=UPI002AD497BF|nr:hypothetical protein [Frankia sp. Cas3]
MDLLREAFGREIASLQGIFYLSESVDAAPSLDSVELVFRDGGSIIFTSATDWILRVSVGAWPQLPEWCWPSKSWVFALVETQIGNAGFVEVVDVKDLHNEVGDFVGSILEFSAGNLVIKSGDAITVELYVTS